VESQQLLTEHCPYCGEPIELLVDSSLGQQDYIEDCQVCCRPIEVSVMVSAEGEASITVNSDSE
jgi:hypothetical protein